MEKSQRTFSLSSWNTDVSPSRAPMASTFVETREAHLWVMVHMSMHLLSGSTDPFNKGPQRGPKMWLQNPLLSAHGGELTGYHFPACFYTGFQVPDPMPGLFLFVFFNWEEVNAREVCVYVFLVNVQRSMPTSNNTHCVKKCNFTKNEIRKVTVQMFQIRFFFFFFQFSFSDKHISATLVSQ